VEQQTLLGMRAAGEETLAVPALALVLVLVVAVDMINVEACQAIEVWRLMMMDTVLAAAAVVVAPVPVLVLVPASLVAGDNMIEADGMLLDM
jgi:hypothetical protein